MSQVPRWKRPKRFFSLLWDGGLCYQGLVYCLKVEKELLKFLDDLESVQRPWVGKKKKQETVQAVSCGNTIANG